MIERIDAHQHFWRPERGDYGWLTPDLAPLWRSFLPADLEPLLSAAGIGGTILVQAAPSVAETRFLLDLAAGSGGMVRGVVGWVPFSEEDSVGVIADLAKDPLLVGLRPMLQDLPDPAWILQPACAPALEACAAEGLVFDALVRPAQIGAIRTLAERHPGLRIVLDHGGKPDIAGGALQPWAGDIARLAACPNVVCKLSGLVTEAGPAWSVERLKPFVAVLLEQFGPERLLWGSDWPVCTLAAGYADWDAATEALLEGLDPSGKAAIRGGTALRIYRRG